ncbi:ketopantoate reductase PanE/ApbA C terminal-domain-containing protein [Cristinia sonorae]|uniref:2-dehydropantoate 2-reductase n=1 Tax=Cristinia sonorae TaxID=1940300 RepID=A0A8K0XNW9_9AGAR|nr:ketopantoate reductase PanE/ApbA C terminal-domain-containing protein [Cristinia sonorae]
MMFHVVGMGAIGCLVSFHLRRASGPSNSLTVIHRTARALREARRLRGKVKVENRGIVQSVSGVHHQLSGTVLRKLPPKRIMTRRRPQRPQPSVTEVVIDGFKKTMMGAFSTQTAALLRSGEFWTRRGTSPRRPKPLIKRRKVKPVVHRVRPINSLFVCVKAQSTLETIRSLLRRLSPNSTIVLMQNGMGVYEELVANLFPNPLTRPHIVSAVITHGAWIKQKLHVVHAGIGKIDVGIMADGQGRDFEATNKRPHHLDFLPLPRLSLDDIAVRTPDFRNDRYRSLRETMEVLLRMDPLEVSWLPIYDVQMSMRRKVVVNAVINPITALLNCKNGQILSLPEGRRICHAVCCEAEAVFRAQWEQERKAAGVTTNDVAFPQALLATQLEKLCAEAASGTANNFSSMLADVRLGRPTEIHYMTGYLVGLGKKYGVRTPTNLALLNMVRMRTALDVGTASKTKPPA